MAAARKAKKTTSTKSSRRKPSAKPVAKKKATARKKSKPKSNRKSVDSILETFGKRRTEQQTKLAAVRKKITQLEAQTKAFQAEIVSLKKAESTAETTIEKLDLDRDQAVRKLLEKLGVKLTGETAAKSTKKKAKRKTGKARSSKKLPVPESFSQFSQTTDAPPVIKAKPLFDTVFRSPTTSNGNSSSEPEFPSGSSSDELLDDELMDDDQN